MDQQKTPAESMNNISDNEWEKQLITTDGNLEAGESSMGVKEIDTIQNGPSVNDQSRSKEISRGDFTEGSQRASLGFNVNKFTSPGIGGGQNPPAHQMSQQLPEQIKEIHEDGELTQMEEEIESVQTPYPPS